MTRSPILLLTLLTSLCWSGVRGDLAINEFVASNGSSYTNAQGLTPDWIEIHNNGPSPADLNGWYLTDDAGNLVKWAFPSTNILANQYLVICADVSSSQVILNELHTNFKLAADGEYLALVYSNGTAMVVHEYSDHERAPGVWGYPPQQYDISYGINAAGDNKYFASPTPGAVNADGVDDKDFTNDLLKRGADIEAKSLQTEAAILEIVNGKIK